MFGGVPTGERWRLTETTAEELLRLLRFRHVVRHLYAWALRREQIDVLARAIDDTHRALARDVAHWSSFLDALARA